MVSFPDRTARLLGSWLDRRRAAVLFVCVVSAVLFGLIVGATLLAVRQPYSGVDWLLRSGLVYSVEPGSPAARAGIQAGDVIVAVDGRPAIESPQVGLTGNAGRFVAFTVQRNGQDRVVSVDVAWPAPAFKLLRDVLPLIVALCFLLFGFFVWAHKPHDLAVRLFLVLTQLGAAVLVFGLLSTLHVANTILGFDLCLSLLSASLIHFHLVFPQPKEFPGKRWIIPGLYVVAMLCTLGPWFVVNQDTGNSGVLLARLGGRIYFALASLATAAMLVHTYKTTVVPSDRRRIRLVVFGTVMALLPLVGLALLPEVLTRTTLLPYEYTFPFLLFIPLAYAVAIYQHNVMQIDRLVNRSVVSLTLLLILALIYLVPSVGFPQLWPATWIDQPLAWGLVTLLIAVIFVPLRERLQAVADRLFYGGWYDYRSVVSQMSQALGGIVDADELAALLVGRLPEILRVRRAALLLMGDENVLSVAATFGPLPPRCPHLSLPRAGVLARELLLAARPLETGELAARLSEAALSDEERSWLACWGTALWAPLIQHSEIEGLLLLTNRIGEEPFDAGDRRILGTLAWQAAVAAENVRLVTVLRNRAAEIEQLYLQLVHSREYERKRLARELHDQVIQDLINLHYYLDPAAPRLASTAQQQAQVLRERLQTAINDIRQVCTELRPAALDDLSLSLAIEGYVEEFMTQHGIRVELFLSQNASRSSEDLPEEISLSLFRVLQEALTNVRRHAQTPEVHVSLDVQSAEITLEVQDAGQGFECPNHLGSLIGSGHFGLAGSQERMSLIGGTLQVESAPGRGTRIRARVPLETGIATDRLDSGRVEPHTEPPRPSSSRPTY